MKQRKNRMMIIALCVINLFASMTHAVEEYRNWDKIIITEETLNFPKEFVWGTASSAFQIEGNQTANGKFSENNWTRDTFRPQPGIAADHWNRYQEDIENIAQAGMRQYRFSVDWSKIEPKKGEIDQAAMDHYVDIARECKKRNIEPIICLFHHVWPTWFADQGAFENIKNKEDFKKFAHRVRENMQPVGVQWWMTYNEPVGVVLESYLRGKLPPGHVGHLIKAGQVLRNMLNTHVEISQEFKQHDKDAKFGIAHIMQPLNPYHDYNPLEKSICNYFGGLNNDTIIEFFKTGKFNWGGLVKDENKAAPASIDYFGLNYYTHSLIKQNMKKTAIGFGASGLAIAALVQKGLIKPSTGLGLGVISAVVSSCLSLSIKSHREGTPVSDEKQIYPEGLRGCIEKAASVGKPIYITENGVSDRSGDKREEYLKKHLYIVSEAIKDGFDIRGYHYWSFMDHFSWSTAGFKKKYGIYEVDYEGNTLTRTLRENAKWFVALMRKHATTR
ncbi:MAG TPA: family 1 glycosylhydrolase [Candidatus Babeliales bacterium]|nr:family 1 glycosylhydrolase [Candidatus Babeliales bacterium]